MRIKKISIWGLYGYIDKIIKFNQDITLLVGINGSGKTSILNLISWIVKPSLANLCVTEFKKIVLTINYKDIDYNIECRHTKRTFKYVVKSSKANDIYEPLVVRLKVEPQRISDDETRNELKANYSNLAPDAKEVKTWEFINGLPNPVIIGLDRNQRIQDRADKLRIEKINIRGAVSLAGNLTISPLSSVKELVNTAYRKSKNDILNLTNELKNSLMFSAFERSISIDSITSGLKQNLTVSQIDSAQKRFEDYLKKFERKFFSDNQLDAISGYFKQLKEITTTYQESPDDAEAKVIFAINVNQFSKLKKLLTEFERFEAESNRILAKIHLYLDTLNSFFKDSYKKLIFKEDTSEIKFHTIDKQGTISSYYRDITSLSSGEQQILMLFSYLAFNDQASSLFIIDEPELSLHIKWQEDFLFALEKLTQPSTQIFIATHSPIIAGKKKSNAVVLLPYND